MAQTSPLNGSELADTHEIVGLADYTVSDISDLAALLSDEQLDLIRNDIDLWKGVRGDGMEMHGGKYGITISPSGDRRFIQSRTRQKLGIAGLGSGGLFNISVGGR